MANPVKKVSHKFGANRKELARKARKHDRNFAQSRDIREDRGERQIKTGARRALIQILPRAR